MKMVSDPGKRTRLERVIFIRMLQLQQDIKKAHD